MTAAYDPTTSTRRVSFHFNEAAQMPAKSPGLTLAVRTDVHHATASIQRHLLDYLHYHGICSAETGDAAVSKVESVTEAAYEAWNHDVLSALAECLDYGRYGLKGVHDEKLAVNFFNSRELGEATFQKAKMLARRADASFPGTPALFVTLDDLIHQQGDMWSEIAFSRLFSLNSEQGQYHARPGHQDMGQQIAALAERTSQLKAKHGKSVPLVFLEDNVRHAKMINWVIGELESGGVFEHAHPVGIATSFCCATLEERNAIRWQNKILPVEAAIDFADATVDVATPRDLLFDGFVVKINDKSTRLPGIFMDVQKLFKIAPDKVDHFKKQVANANQKFCDRIESAFDVHLPMKWFSVSDAVAHVTGHQPDTRMRDVFEPRRSPDAHEYG